jgi:hypothetical protein
LHPRITTSYIHLQNCNPTITFRGTLIEPLFAGLPL